MRLLSVVFFVIFYPDGFGMETEIMDMELMETDQMDLDTATASGVTGPSEVSMSSEFGDESGEIMETPLKLKLKLKKSVNWEIVQDEEKLYLGTGTATAPAEAHEEKEIGIKQDHKVKVNSPPAAVAVWRDGPGSYWFDMMGVPEDATQYDYGFKGQEDQEVNEDEDAEQNESKGLGSNSFEFEEGAFHPVAQVDWESDIIWDVEDDNVKKFNKNERAEWSPGRPKTAPAHRKPKSGFLNWKAGASEFPTTTKSKVQEEDQRLLADDTWYSIFPVEPEELVKHAWEDEVIWDVDKVHKIPEPKILTLDLNDENLIIYMPDDVDPKSSHAAERGNSTPARVKIPHPHVKKSKTLLGKVGVIKGNVIEDECGSPKKYDKDKDPYNISNDEYYAPRHVKLSSFTNNLQHSTPVVELSAPCIPTHLGPIQLRNFHRPGLKKISSGPLGSLGPHPVHALTAHINKKAKQREFERLAAGGGDSFVMRTLEDISGKDGRLVLVEYCEEHPPLLSQVGMCSKIKNYFKRHAEKNVARPELPLGETTFAHTSPFLGTMRPGQLIQTIENNLYRSPIYEHPRLDSDFILLRSRHNFTIREYDHLFTAGQECPLFEVPGPNCKRANNFVRDFLQVFIYRLFWRSRDNPSRIRIDDIKRAFPSHSEGAIRKRLKLCADFEPMWWVLKPQFRLPTEEELRAMVSPEQCCAYFSLAAAEQRLKDAGVGEKFLFAPQTDDDEENQSKMDDEVKAAPWNTTRAYCQALKGHSLLQLVGPADPTGIGEGFSYIRVPNKPMASKEELESQPKRVVTGTDADLRRLSLSNAKNVLRTFSVPEEEIRKLSRWEVIDVVRTLSNENVKQGSKGITKFSRGNRFSMAEHHGRYKEECQRIFDLQNRILMTSDPLTSDEDEGDSNEEEEVDDAIEEMVTNIENMLWNRKTKTSTQCFHEKEEQERIELRKMMLGDGKEDGAKKAKEDAKTDGENTNKLNKLGSMPGRILKIHRTFKTPDCKEFTRTETVRNTAVIDIYVRMRSLKDEPSIRSFTLSGESKEEMKKEKRRLQVMLCRIKRNEDKELQQQQQQQQQHRHSQHRRPVSRPVAVVKKRKIRPELKIVCGACDQVGHMRTNKDCPLNQDQDTDPCPAPVRPAPVLSINVAMTEAQKEELEKELNTGEGEELVQLDGTKVHISSKLIRHAKDVKRRSLLLKVPKAAILAKRTKTKKGDEDPDYHIYATNKTINRRRIDPRVMISNIFATILNDMRSEPDSNSFWVPVTEKTAPAYHKYVKTPMDLQTMRDKNRQYKYDSHVEFLDDAQLLVENSIKYNGDEHLVTVYAKKIYNIAEQEIEANMAKLSRYEQMINPLLDDNVQKKLNYILTKIIDSVKKLPEASSFLKPVNKRSFKNYYEVIKNPMDLETMENKISDDFYKSRYDFLADLDLIQFNAVQFNGAGSWFDTSAAACSDFVKKSLEPFDEHLTLLEISIQKDLVAGKNNKQGMSVEMES